MLGADAIITGSLVSIDDSYRLTLKAINIKTATVSASYSVDIVNDNRVSALLSPMEDPGISLSKDTQSINQKLQPNQISSIYKIGDTGPAGGIIFYDKGNTIGGWRYLEAAPENTETKALFPYSGYDLLVGSRKVGDGKENTKKFMDLFAQKGGGINTAPWLCNDLVVNGFDDWYLPSVDELLYIYNNLYLKGLGGLKQAVYCSSYVNGIWAFYAINFSDGSEKKPGYSENTKYFVRAIRRF